MLTWSSRCINVGARVHRVIRWGCPSPGLSAFCDSAAAQINLCLFKFVYCLSLRFPSSPKLCAHPECIASYQLVKRQPIAAQGQRVSSCLLSSRSYWVPVCPVWYSRHPPVSPRHQPSLASYLALTLSWLSTVTQRPTAALCTKYDNKDGTTDFD